MGTQDRVVENIHTLISLSFHFAYSELWLILPTPPTIFTVVVRLSRNERCEHSMKKCGVISDVV